MSIPPHICLVSETSKVAYEDLKLIADAIDKELVTFCDVWDLELWRCDAVTALTDTHVRVSQVVLHVKDSTSVPDALGWHTDENGKIFGEIAAGDILGYGGKRYSPGSYPSVAAVIAHEVFETIVNPRVNLWVDRGDGKTEDAREACDAVQGASFTVPVRGTGGAVKQVELCNYLLPAWFDAQTTETKFDRLGLCKAPFEVLQSGYHVTRVTGPEKASGGESLPVADPTPLEDPAEVLEPVDGVTDAPVEPEAQNTAGDPFAATAGGPPASRLPPLAPEPVVMVTTIVGVGSPGIQARALTKRRPRALHGLGPAFRVAAVPAPELVPLAIEPELETASTEPAPAPAAEGGPASSLLSPPSSLEPVPEG